MVSAGIQPFWLIPLAVHVYVLMLTAPLLCPAAWLCVLVHSHTNMPRPPLCFSGKRGVPQHLCQHSSRQQLHSNVQLGVQRQPYGGVCANPQRSQWCCMGNNSHWIMYCR
jgi:hypothetical protein